MRAQIDERHTSRTVELGGATVRRLLPRRDRRTVGAWCFLDHFGPTTREEAAALAIGPHPHIGLHTVTWLVEGELEHRDSLGSRQRIIPGQLNLMTAGDGISHAELAVPDTTSVLHGAQLWVAQPEATRHGPPAFAHHAELPTVAHGGWTATVILGAWGGAESPASTDTPIVGAALTTDGPASAVVTLRPGWEHAVAVLAGRAEVAGEPLAPGEVVVIGAGPDELELRTEEPVHLLVLGGEPFDEELLMWWNLVARTPEEIRAGAEDWAAGAERFGTVDTEVARVPAPALGPFARRQG